MRGIAREEHPPRPVPTSHDTVPAPGLRGKYLHVDRRTHGFVHPSDRVRGLRLFLQVDGEPPLVHAVDHRDVRPALRRQGLYLRRWATQTLPEQFQQLRGTKMHREVLALREHAVERDAQCPADTTTAPVTRHEIRAGQCLGSAAFQVAHHGRNSVGVLLERFQAGTEPDLDPRQVSCGPFEQRQERELGKERGAFRRQQTVLAGGAVRDPVVELGENVARHSRGEDDAVWVVRRRC